MFELFQTFLYQPFFNLLVGLYWILNKIPSADIDMGWTVVIFAIIVRIILLPVSIAAHRSEKERREIASKIVEIEKHFKDNPVAIREETKKVLRGNRRILVAELISLGIQVSISLILWAIFSSGLSGKDSHLLYPWMPNIFPIPPEKMMFMGFSLDHPHWQLNLLQSVLILILEALATYLSPYPVKEGEVVRYQVFLPIVSFAIFAFLPAGKKLFVITTLAFSIVLTLGLAIRKKAYDIAERLRLRDEAAAQPQEDKVVVEIKG